MGDDWDFGMPLNEAMETQRAIRRLKPDALDDAVILRLIDLARRAPTSSNAQNWEFIIVKDPKVKEGLAPYNRQVWQLMRRIRRSATREDPQPAEEPGCRSMAG